MSLSPEVVNSDLPALHDDENVEVKVVPQHSDALKTQTSTTPPSSPPVYQRTMALPSQDMPPPTAPASKTRKRSRGEGAENAINVPDSSAPVTEAFDPLSSQRQDNEQDTTTDFTAANMPNAQVQRLGRSSQPAPTSAQSAGITHRQRTTTKPERTSKNDPPPQQLQQEPRSEEDEPNSDITTTSNDPGLPEDPLEDYDWSELESRYHDKLAVLQHREMENFQELSDLIAFFEIWAEVGGRKEDDRGFKRLKTQMAYVQHQEDELENRRLHYIRVVDAFKTVGVMLKEPNWAQSFIPDHGSLSKVRRSILRHATGSKGVSARPKKRQREPRITPLIQAEEWAVRVVDDVDMRRFGCRNRHVARCVIL